MACEARVWFDAVCSAHQSVGASAAYNRSSSSILVILSTSRHLVSRAGAPPGGECGVQSFAVMQVRDPIHHAPQRESRRRHTRPYVTTRRATMYVDDDIKNARWLADEAATVHR